MDPFDWNPIATRGIVRLPQDEEADRYRMLAYLQRIKARYQERKLYPYLDELADRIHALSALRSALGQTATGPLRPGASAMIPHSVERSPLHELEALLGSALPALSEVWEEGHELSLDLRARLHMEPIGVRPLRKDEGYLLLRQGNNARVYLYAARRIALPAAHPPHQEIITHYVTDYALGITCTFEHVKLDLVRRATPLPNPAVYAITADLELPALETFVPLAKQLIREELARDAA